jgi:diaminopimelate decarboxylase
MSFIHRVNDQWFAENVPIQLIEKEVKTPCYVYSKSLLTKNWLAFNNAFTNTSHQVHYAVKANSNIAILHTLAQLGSGFDIVSGGELHRVLKAKGDPQKIIFSGVGKSTEELTLALTHKVGCINVESEEEAFRLSHIASTLQTNASIALRINPNVNPNSHPYISTGQGESKFGIAIDNALDAFKAIHTLPNITIQGIAFHIGSQITTLDPFLTALKKILLLIDELEINNISINHLNIGGGLGVSYQNEAIPTPEAYINAILSIIANRNLTIHIEPGRAIIANAGILLTRVEYIKARSAPDYYFAIVDAGMNDLLRPALYNAWHDIIPLHNRMETKQHYDIVGPVCESGDWLGKDRYLSLKSGDLLAITFAGAYGFSMSSNYNSRPRAAEVLVDGTAYSVIRSREMMEDLLRSERIPN